MRIGVTEDYSLVAWALRLLVLDAGHWVTWIAPCPVSTMEAARRDKPDLVLMDIRLAGDTSGCDASQQLWEELGVRSLYLTAYRQDAVPQPGVIGLLLKPYNRLEVCQSLEAVEAIMKGETPGVVPRQLTLY